MITKEISYISLDSFSGSLSISTEYPLDTDRLPKNIIYIHWILINYLELYNIKAKKIIKMK